MPQQQSHGTEKMVRIANDELARNSSAEQERFSILEARLAEAEAPLGKLYDALETGEFGSGELARRKRI